MADADPRDDHADNYDLNEKVRPWSEVRPELVARLKRKLANADDPSSFGIGRTRPELIDRD